MDGTAPRITGRAPRRLLPALVAVLAVALGAATAAASARADGGAAARWPAGGSTLRAAMGLGAEHWGMDPCAGHVTLSWTRLDAGIDAQSSWANDRDPYLQPSFNTECEIALSTAAEWDWVKLCTVVVHEVGHLTGHDHVDDPADVMYYGYVDPARECALTPEPIETGAPPAPAAKPRGATKASASKPAPRRKATARKAKQRKAARRGR
jgi:hypothetical protein